MQGRVNNPKVNRCLSWVYLRQCTTTTPSYFQHLRKCELNDLEGWKSPSHQYYQYYALSGVSQYPHHPSPDTSSSCTSRPLSVMTFARSRRDRYNLTVSSTNYIHSKLFLSALRGLLTLERSVKLQWYKPWPCK